MSAKIPPKPSKDVIYVDVDDEITSIIDKIENTEQKVVALVLPKRAASLQSIVNMKLLKRSADAAGKNPVLITSEAALIPLAGAAGLHVAKNLQSKPEVPEAPAGAVLGRDMPAAEEGTVDSEEDLDEENLPGKIDYERSIGALAASHETDNPETIDLDDEDEAGAEASAKPAKAPKVKGVKVPNFDRFRMMLGLGVLGGLAFIVFIILAIFVLPKATITIQTTSVPVSASFNLAASTATTAVDSAKGAIPAKLETTDQTGAQQVTATGKQNNGDKATGSVNFSSRACNVTNPFNPPEKLSAGSGVTAGSLNFITQQDTTFTISGASPSGSPNCYTYPSTSSTTIKALNGGSNYNMPSGTTFSLSSRGISGSGSTSGGTDNNVTILTQSDVDGAKQKLTTGTTADEFTKAFEKKLSDAGAYVLSSTLKAGNANITSSPSVGQPASTANVTIKITYTVLTVKKTDLSKIIEDKTSSQIDKTKQKLNGNFLDDASITVQSQSSPSAATLAVNEDTTAVPIINVATVKKQVKGKKTGDIKSAIGNWSGVKEVDVKLSPFWVSKVPKQDGKVTVIIKEIKANPKTSEP